jgi:hypothetical protein
MVCLCTGCNHIRFVPLFPRNSTRLLVADGAIVVAYARLLGVIFVESLGRYVHVLSGMSNCCSIEPMKFSIVDPVISALHELQPWQPLLPEFSSIAIMETGNTTMEPVSVRTAMMICQFIPWNVVSAPLNFVDAAPETDCEWILKLVS